MGIYTTLAVRRMKDRHPGDTVTRDEMAGIIGRSCDVGTLGYGNVNSAIRHVESNYGLVWRWSKTSQAWRCLDDNERVDEEGHQNMAARRRVRRSLSVAKTVDVGKLDDDRRKDHTLNVAMAGMVVLCTGSGIRKRLGESNGSLKQPELGKLVELMKS
jgi:hypothetical protein